MATVDDVETIKAKAVAAAVHDFSLASAIYLDGAARSPMPASVAAAGAAALALKQQPWTIPDHTAMLRAVRRDFLRLLSVTESELDQRVEEVAVTTSTSFAVSNIANNLPLTSSRYTVLVLQGQMSSNVLPWQALCARHSHLGAKLRVVARPVEEIASFDWTQAVERSIMEDSSIATVALPNFLWTDGSALDLVHISRLCQQKNIALVLDLTQSLGVVPFNVDQIRPLAVVCSVHKWLLGPYGFSLMWLDPARTQGWQPLEHHERNRLGADGSSWDTFGAMGMDGYPTEFYPGARKFDSGGRPNPVGLPMLAAALQYLQTWRTHEIARHCAALSSRFVEGARKLRFVVPRHHAPHIVGLYVPRGFSLSAVDVAAKLKARSIFLSVRSGALRFSFHIYNTISDVDAALAALQEISQPATSS